MPHLAQVRFVFPFRLPLAASEFIFNFEGARAAIVVHSRLALRHTVFVDPRLRLANAQRKKHIFCNPADQTQHVRTLVFVQHQTPLIEEMTDTVAVTQIDVSFERPGDCPPDNERPSEQLLDEVRASGLKRVRYFVRAYRNRTDEPDVFVPALPDSPVVEVSFSRQYSFDDAFLKFQTASTHTTLFAESVERTGIGKPIADEAACLTLARQLRAATPITMVHELMIDASQLSTLHSNFRLSIVLSQTALEVFLQRRLEEECTQRGIAELEGTSGRRRPVAEALSRGSLESDLLGRYAQQLAGRSVKDCGQYQDWYRYAYMPRKEIIHKGGLVDASEEDGKRAWQSVMAYTAVLDRLLIAGRSTTSGAGPPHS